MTAVLADPAALAEPPPIPIQVAESSACPVVCWVALGAVHWPLTLVKVVPAGR